MQESKKSFSFFGTLLAVLVLVVFGLVIYLYYTGVRIKYDSGLKRYLLDVSKNDFVKSLSSKYFSDFVTKETSESTSSVEKATNPFKKINEEAVRPKNVPLDRMAPDIIEKYKNEPEDFYFFKIGWDIERVDPAGSWDYAKTAFVSEIVSYNKDLNELTLKITAPNSMPYFGQTISTKVGCAADKSFLGQGGKTFNPISDLKQYFSVVSPTFIGQCTDGQCSEVGPFCKVSL